jgi:uncharacterized protein YlxW (UPF0749 family)
MTDDSNRPSDVPSEQRPTALDAPASTESAPSSPPNVGSARDRRSLLAVLRSPPSRGQLLIALLLAVLGFALALQVRSTNTDDTLRSARQSDLVRILDDLSERSDRLRSEVRSLEETRDRLTSGADRNEAALEESQVRRETLGILAGTVATTGPGIELVITDPENRVRAALILDAIQELRDAGAEAMQVDDVRIVADTFLVDRDNRVVIEGTEVSSPIRIIAIGDPPTLASALDIPGGVLEVLRGEGATAEVVQRDQVTVDALRAPQTPQYARPAPQPEGG